MTEFILSGFWQAFLFTVIIGAIGGIIGFVLKKKASVLAAIFQNAGTFAFFYVWHIRHGIGWLIFAILGAIGLVGMIIGAVFGSKKVSTKIAGVVKLDTDEELKNFAEQSNANFPKMVNPTTRIESVDTKASKIIVFHVTLLNLNNGDESIPSIKSNVHTNMIANMKNGTDAETVIYRNNHISCRYVYNDANGNHLFDVDITPNDYL
jgi:Cu/Ag efflux protein CusF